MKQRYKLRTGALRNVNTKLKILGFALVTTVLFCYMHLRGRRSDNPALAFFKENVRFLDALNATACVLPSYDLYDRSIRPYISKPPTEIVCGYLQPYLTFLDWDGRLHLNQTEVDANNYRNLQCIYQTVTGNRDNDYVVDYGPDTVIASFPLTIEVPVIRVKCTAKGKQIYIMVHSHIKPLDPKKIEDNNKIPSHRPSVLIFTIDSMSRGNFIRSLPKTYEYLVNNLNLTVFKGLNKVADNTYPNMMALLAGFMGRKRPELPNIPVWTIKENSTIKRYDDMPIIWRSFGDSGYITMYAEEYLDATFSLFDVGFLEDPVDYYYRAAYVSLKQTLGNINMNRLRFWDRSKWRYCVANQPSYKHMLNYTEEFLTEMADLKYFSLSFFVEMSHEYLTDIKNMDDDLLDFFSRMSETGKFNNTVLLVMGDHGHRFDAIRSTFIGRIEERMPFLGISLPETLQKSHPHLQKGLDYHTERLLSWYDIHETLVDLAEDHLEEKPEKFRPQAIGKSIFRPFDDNRTCSQIGILPEYCMCDREAQIPAQSEKAKISAELALVRINRLLEDSGRYVNSGESRRCAHLTLDHISSASMSMRSFSSGKSTLLIRVMFKVNPSEGMFEAAVEHGPDIPPSVLGDVNRINKYGSQPSCISHDILRLYCYCV